MATNLDPAAAFARALFPSVDGATTSFKALAATRGRPIALMIGESAWLIVLVLFAVRSFA